VQKRLDAIQPIVPAHKERKVLIVMDTMYFGRSYGVMVFRDWYQRVNLLWKFIDYETIALYQQGIRELQQLGYQVVAIVADGRRGIFNSFDGIPIQMCQFHQKQIVKRYLTSRPKLQAGIELKFIVDRLSCTDEPSFTGWLKEWYCRWESFLKETTVHPETLRKSYTHKSLRSAYFSLMHNLTYLFTCQSRIELGIPTTTNTLDGSFAHIKDKVRIHHGLKQARKQKLIEELLLCKSTTKF
jgi:hypothetical protein